MDTSNIIAGLRSGVGLIDILTPVAKEHGLGGNLLPIVASLAAIGANALERIEEGKLVASERDRAVIEAINRELAIANDKLAKMIAES